MSKLGQSVKDTVSTAKDSLTGGGGKGSKAKKQKLTNIVEQLDIGAPVELVYDQWTQFADFPKFMKKVEQVEQVADEKVSFTGHVFWSRRTWESTILEQVPFERIVWRSKGAKGYIDGAVTFHEIGPNLTRILVVLEYHPNGFFEKTANIWRAAGRRCRLELKAFERHIMTEALLHSDDIVGWHGEIRDGEVVEDDETARQAEAEDAEDEANEDGEPTDEEGEEEEGEPVDEEDENVELQDEDAELQDERDRPGEAGAEDNGEDEVSEPVRSRRSAARRAAREPRRNRERRGART